MRIDGTIGDAALSIVCSPPAPLGGHRVRYLIPIASTFRPALQLRQEQLVGEAPVLSERPKQPQVLAQMNQRVVLRLAEALPIRVHVLAQVIEYQRVAQLLIGNSELASKHKLSQARVREPRKPFGMCLMYVSQVMLQEGNAASKRANAYTSEERVRSAACTKSHLFAAQRIASSALHTMLKDSFVLPSVFGRTISGSRCAFGR